MTLSPRSDAVPIDPEFVPDWVSTVNTAQYFQVAITTTLVYDTITTMDKEIKYFWKTPISSVTVVYFVNRYVGIVGAAANLIWNAYYANFALCRFAAWTFSISMWFSVILIDYVLMIRVLALFSEERKLSITLKLLLALEAASKAVAVVYVTLYESITVGQLASNAAVCGIGQVLSFWWIAIDWIIPLAYAVILMALALYKATEFWKMSSGFHGFHLVQVLIKDQAIYFILVVSCCVFNIVVFKAEISDDFVVQVLALLGSPSFLCILGSRVSFNSKDAGERGVNCETSYRMPTMSNIEFA